MTTAPIDCRAAMQELWDYLDSQLPGERTEQIRAHLATCTGCESHMQFCRAFLRQIDMPDVAATQVAALRDRVRSALQKDGITTEI